MWGGIFCYEFNKNVYKCLALNADVDLMFVNLFLISYFCELCSCMHTVSTYQLCFQGRVLHPLWENCHQKATACCYGIGHFHYFKNTQCWHNLIVNLHFTFTYCIATWLWNGPRLQRRRFVTKLGGPGGECRRCDDRGAEGTLGGGGWV